MHSYSTNCILQRLYIFIHSLTEHRYIVLDKKCFGNNIIFYSQSLPHSLRESHPLTTLLTNLSEKLDLIELTSFLHYIVNISFIFLPIQLLAIISLLNRFGLLFYIKSHFNTKILLLNTGNTAKLISCF